MVKEILPNVWSWSWLSEERGYNFNGFVVIDGFRRVMIDPVRVRNDKKELLLSLGPFEATYLTCKKHERDAYGIRREWQVPIYINENDVRTLKERPDMTFSDGDRLACGIQAVNLEGQRSPGESAFYIADRKILILGSALIGEKAGTLHLPPSKHHRGLGAARKGLERLRSLPVESILVGLGEHILSNGSFALEQFFSTAEQVAA